MPPEPASTHTILPKKRFSEVDSLRAIACALVIISHTGLWPMWLHHVLIDTFEAGVLGVVLFFAISGFVIPDSLRGTRWQGIKTFSTRRFWRLYPPFWAALLLTWWIEPQYRSRAWGWDAVMLPSLGGAEHAFSQFWTLEVELVFYMLVAALFFIFGRLGWKVILPSYLLLAVLAFRKVTAPNAALDYDTMLPHLVIMFWGALCREILRLDFSRWQWFSPKFGVNWARSVALGMPSGITTIVLIMYYSGMRGTGRSYELAGLFGILEFLFWVILTPARLRFLAKVGCWTYSTYLLHGSVLFISRSIFDISFFRESYCIPPLFPILSLIVSFALGALAYRSVEQPSNHIGKQLTTKRQRPSTLQMDS